MKPAKITLKQLNKYSNITKKTKKGILKSILDKFFPEKDFNKFYNDNKNKY